MYLQHRANMKKNELLKARQVNSSDRSSRSEVEVRPVEGQIDDLIGEVNKEIANKHKNTDNNTDQTYGRRPY